LNQKQTEIMLLDTLILCGGSGTRLKPVISNKPKILAKIDGIPFIEYLLNYLESEGIKRIILCTGYKHNQIKAWVNSSYDGDLDIIFSREKKQLGTGGAIKNAEELISSKNFLVINGDTFTELDYKSFVKYFVNKNAVGLIALKKIEKAEAYGNIVIDSMNRIISFIEKGNELDDDYTDSLINAGVYLFNKVCLDYIPNDIKVSLEYNTIQLILKKFQGSVYGFCSEGSFIDIGTPLNYYRANKVINKYAKPQ